MLAWALPRLLASARVARASLYEGINAGDYTHSLAKDLEIEG